MKELTVLCGQSESLLTVFMREIHDVVRLDGSMETEVSCAELFW